MDFLTSLLLSLILNHTAPQFVSSPVEIDPVNIVTCQTPDVTPEIKAEICIRRQSPEDYASAAAMMAPLLSAVKSFALVGTDTGPAGPSPGDVLEYTIVISNSAGAMDATGTVFTDQVDANTTLVPGTLKTSVIAVNDAYTTVGNTSISVPAGSGLLVNDINLDGDVITVTAVNTAGTMGNVTFNPDGSFTFNPSPGFEGTTTFTYTVNDGTFSTMGTVSVTVAGMIWYVQAGAAAPGDGRFGSPFSSIANFNTLAADDPNDNIFLYTGAYSGSLILLNGQNLIGQGATGGTLASLAGVTFSAFPPISGSLPSVGGSNPTIAGTATTLTTGQNNDVLGVTINNTSGSAFIGNNFGTLKVRNVVISNTGGVALNFGNGTLDAIFLSVSASNSSNGITILNTTGSLQITGTGTTDASGGTLSAITGRGIDIRNATNITLKNMNLSSANTTSDGGFDTQCDEDDVAACFAALYLNVVSTVNLDNIDIGSTEEHGIMGLSVSNLTINNCTATGNGNSNEENALKFRNISGTCAITNSTFQLSAFRIAHIINTTGNLNLTVSNCTFDNSAASPVGQDCFELRTQSSATATVNITNSVFQRAKSKGIQAFAEGNSTLSINITGCSVQRMGGLMAGIEVGSNGAAATVNYNINNNTIIESSGEVAVLASTFITSDLNGRTNFNPQITNNNATASIFSNMRILHEGNGQAIAEIKNNMAVISSNIDIPVDIVTVNGNNAAARIDITMDNNNITNSTTTVAGLEGIVLRAGEAVAGTDINTLCGNIINNDLTLPVSYPRAFRVRYLDPTSFINLAGMGPNVTTNWMTNMNTNTNGAITSGPTTTITFGPGCNTPTHPLMSTENEVASALKDTDWDKTEDKLVDEVKSEPDFSDGLTVKTDQTAMSLLSGETVIVGGMGGFSLPAGKDITIKFQVTINDPFPLGVCQVSNQGSVSGSNFATFLTDDTSVAGPANPTVTNLNIAPVITTCPPGLVVNTNKPNCTSTQSFAAVANGCPAVTFTYKIGMTTITSPYDFPIGMSVVDVTASNGVGMPATCSFTVTVNPAPAAFNVTGGGTICAGDPGIVINLSGSEIGINYQLKNGMTDVGLPEAGTGMPIIFPAQNAAGTYTVVAIGAGGCSTTMIGNAVINVIPQPVSNAGVDQGTCGNTGIVLAATAINGTGTWSIVSGPSLSLAQFSSTTAANATFTPAGGPGMYTLRWTVSSLPCPDDTDDVVITSSIQPTGNAGMDQTLCAVSAQLAAVLADGTGVWSIVSGPSLSNTQFSNINDNNATFTPAAASGVYVLRWTVSAPGCPDAVDDVMVTFNLMPTTANAGPDQNVCGTAATLAGNTPTAGTGAWSIISGAGGSVTTPSSPASGFTGIAGTVYTLRWTISNAPCLSSTDDVVITLTESPTTANAGPDQNVCGTSATLAANAPTVGTGSWSIISGAGGTITTPSSPVSGFSGVAGTVYTLRWTITNDPCVASTDDVMITFTAMPTTANAGPDINTCVNPGTANMAANTPAVGSASWSQIGGPVMTSFGINNPVTIVVGLNTAGTYTYVWTITNGTCPPSRDTMTITVNANPPTFTLAGGGTYCPGSTMLSGPVDPNYTYTWQRSLSGIANPNSYTNFGGNVPTQAVTSSGNYRLIITNPAGCSTSDTTVVHMADYVFNGSLAVGDAQQTGRLNRFAVVSTCAAPKSCPLTFTTSGARFYDSYSITNIQNVPVCATIGLTSGCGTSLFNVAYLGSFNPTSLCTNYLADPGSSFPGTGFMEVIVPANATIVVVVHEVNPGTGCSNYRLTVDMPRDLSPVVAAPPSVPCGGGSSTLTAPVANSYLWSPGGAVTQSINTPTLFMSTKYFVNLGYGNMGCTRLDSVNVIVTGTSPTVTCPANIELSNTTNQCGRAVTYATTVVGTPTPTVTYTFTGATTGSGSGDGSGSFFNVGTTNVTVNVANACGSSSCSFTVKINDTQPPDVTTGTIAACYPSVAAAEAAALAATSATDNCPGVLTETASTTGTCSAVVTVTTTDANNNSTAVTYNTRIDNTPPSVTTGTIAACYPTVAAAEAAALAATSATDDCPGALTEVASTTGTCSAVIIVTTSDGCGNATAVTYNTRIDNMPPSVTTGTIAACYPSVAAAEAAALAATSATDNCPGALTEIASTTGTCSAVVTVTTTDGCGNATAITYNTRIDNTPPSVTTGTIAACYPTVAAAEAAALAATSATDNCPGALTEVASTTGTCSAVVTVTTTDGCGNATAVTYNTRIDNTPPSVTTGTIAACYPTVAAAEAAALAATSTTDDCPGALTEVASTTGTCSAVVTVTTTDGCGNATAVTYNTRIDNTPPALTCPGPVVVCGTAAVPVADINTVTGVSDNCPGTVTVTHVGDVVNGFSSTAPYTITRTYRATDGCGNFSDCTQTITVNPIPNAIATPSTQAICTNTAITPIILSGAVSGTIFNWTRDNIMSVTGIPANGSGNISGTLTNTTNGPVTVTFTINPIANGCPGPAITATVLVNPPIVVTTSNLCNGGTTVTFTQSSTAPGTWSVSGGGTIVAATGVFTPTTPGCFTATYTTTIASCSDTKNFVVFPAAPAAPVVSNTCNTAITVPALSAVTGFTAQYSFDNGTTWANSNVSPATPGCYSIRTRYVTTSACGTIPANTIAPAACAQSNVSYAVIFPAVPAAPVVTNTCNTAITVPALTAVTGFTAQYSYDDGTTWGTGNQSPLTPACYTIRTRYVTTAACGTIAANTTAPPACAQSGASNAVIFPAAPALFMPAATCMDEFALPAVPAVAGFTVEYSIDNGPFSTNPMPTMVPGCYNIRARYILTNSCGNTAAGSTGTGNCGISNTVTANVLPIPDVVDQPDIVVCNLSTVSPLPFTSLVNVPACLNAQITYRWTNSNPSIGLAASGTGNIPSFNAVNYGLALIRVTPEISLGGTTCTGPVMSFLITVYKPAELVCGGHVNASLDENCQFDPQADIFLINAIPEGNSSIYDVIIRTNGGKIVLPSELAEYVGQILNVTIIDRCNGNSCASTMLIEDKLPPVLACGSCADPISGVVDGPILANRPTFPVPGVGCIPSAAGVNVEYVLHPFSVSAAGNYTWNIGTVATNVAGGADDLVVALYNGPFNPANVCQNMLISDVAWSGTPTGANLLYASVPLNPGNYTLLVTTRNTAGAGTPYSIDILNLATGQTILVSPDNCDVKCVDKAALLDFVSKKQVNNIVNVCGIPTPVIVSGYCGGTPVWDVKLKGDYSDNCGGYIVLEWTIKERSGLSTSVECRVNIVGMTIADVSLPLGITAPLYLECKDELSADAIASAYGVASAYPYFTDKGGNQRPISDLCNFYTYYSDITFDACGPHCHGNKKVVRKWTILDWCTGTITEATQIIKAVDQEAPTFIVKDTVVSTRPWDCTGDFYLPIPWELHDNCDADPKWEVIAPEGVWVRYEAAVGKWRASGAPCGVTTFTYKATDCCGNAGTRTMVVTVNDKTAPVAVAKQNIVVSLVPGYDAGGQTDGQAKIFVESVNNGSFDNCSGIRMELRRKDAISCGNIGNNNHNNNGTFSNFPNGAPNNNANDTDFGEFVKFCCADIPEGESFGIVEVEMRVWDDGNKNGVVGDAGDNWNLTWTNVRVDCKIPPVITCPADATIYCDWAIPTNVANGAPGTDNAAAKPVTDAAYDFAKTGLPTAYGVCVKPEVTFWDREFFNQCDLGYILRTFIVKDKGFTVTCVQRIDVLQSLAQNPWTFIPSSLSTTPIPLTGPTACEGPTEAQIKANAPKYTAGPCDVIGVSTKQWQFDFEDGVCRKWKVEYKYVNWCTLEERGPYYKYFIYEDTKAPEFTTCRDTMYAVDGNCEAVVKLNKTAIDTSGCISTGWLKWEVYIDLWADGDNDYLFSSFYSGADGAIREIGGDAVKQYKLGPGSQYTNLGSANATSSGGKLEITIPEKIVGKMSNHKVSWKVTDGCHNFTTCHEIFMVADKKAPTPVCVPLSTALMQDPDGNGPLLPMVELWAIDFMTKAYDNCTAEEDLLYTFDDWAPQVELKLDANGNPMSIDHPHFFGANGGVASAVNPNTSAYNAARAQYLAGALQLWIPANRSSARVWVSSTYTPGTYKEVDVHVTVWDKKFNHDYCWTTLKLGYGGEGTGTRIAGKVKTEQGQGVLQTMIVAEAALPEYPKQDMTDETGSYDMDITGTTTLKAQKDGDDINGVSTLDLVMIQRHILGLQALTSPYKLIAADANNDGKVTASDLTEIRKLVLGIINGYTNNTSWRFPIHNQTMDSSNPFPYIETVTAYTGLQNQDLDFVAVKIGDVNGNVSTNISNPSTEARSKNSVVLAVEEREVKAGEVVEIPVRASRFEEVLGYQFTMNLKGASFVGVNAGALDVNTNNIGVLNNGVVTMSYAATEAVTANNGDVLFTLIVKADKATKVSEMMTLGSAVTPAESYNTTWNVGQISLEVRTTPVAGITLKQNEPNPFRAQTTVSFYMPEAAKATLTVFDVTGKVVTVRNIAAVKGENNELFTKEQLGASGILYYTLESGEFTATKKMIIVE